ncbi:MAG TPA: hypothetical protein VEC06_06555 [Paucimonas sp.]|nr:hypothetical protein [Paucimonas sp.]
MDRTGSIFRIARLACAAFLGIFFGVAHAQAPTAMDLADNNQAFIKLDKTNTSIGSQFGMHFISTLKINGTIWAYYIRWENPSNPSDPRGGIGLAKSTDGVNFTDHGPVLRAGPAGSWDSFMASFPGIWYDNGTFYLVYEGSGTAGTNSPGAIGLATSTDGVNFTKHGIILNRNTYGWERTNIGTPSLYKEGSTWYLFYHGFDGATCQIGLATGPSLTSLTKHAGNPVIRSVPSTWQSGTAGKRDIVKVNGKYYMVYEGSGPQPYDTAKWSSGVASSSDLFNWTTFSQNAVLPQTANTFGNDGPAFLNVGGLNYVYYRAGGGTRRALIANESYGGFDRSWSMSSPGIGHIIGRAEADGGWSVNVTDRQNYMQYGPYTTALSAGEQIATWKAMIDNNTADNLKVLRMEVVDADDNGYIIAQREITRKQWKQPFRYEYFSVPFTLPASRVGHRIELRVWWYGIAYVKILTVGVS